MAGDWIKMRSELRTHPRMLALADKLIYGEGRSGIGFLEYVCGDLGLDALPKGDNSVTELALRRVTSRALRDVTLAVTLSVWCAINAHGKVDGDDVVCRPMCLDDIDTLAGFDGFGEAMGKVGWAVQENVNGGHQLRFPGFLEHNRPASARSRAKTGAERQREYRERKKVGAVEPDTPPETPVTAVTKSDGREEKRREEKSTSPSLRSGENTRARRKSRAITDEEFEAMLQVSALGLETQNAIRDWREYKQEQWGQTYVGKTWAASISKAERDQGAFTASVRYTIENGWKNLKKPEAPAAGQGLVSGGAAVNPAALSYQVQNELLKRQRAADLDSWVAEDGADAIDTDGKVIG